MTWVPSRRGWMKNYRGKPYAVSCRQLGTDRTKDGSVLAANLWWEEKQKELDSQREHIEPTTKENRAVYHKMAQWYMGQKDRTAAADVLDQAVATGYADPLATLPAASQKIWADRFESLDNEQQGRITVAVAASKWIARQRSRVEAGLVTVLLFEVYRRATENFAAFVGPGKSIEAINTDLVDHWYNHLLAEIAKGAADSYTKSRFDISKQFIRYCVTMFDISMPKNLIDPRFLTIKVRKTKNKVLSIDTIQNLLPQLQGREKLCVLLMLNCGYTASDIARLKHDEVNWTTGRITRKRSKTGDNESTPTVCYKLWDETFALLKQHRSKHAELVLLNRDGNPLQCSKINAKGKGSRSCAILLAWKRAKRTINLKLMRKTSSSLLYNNPTFRGLHTLFLGHAPKSVAEVFYVANNETILDDAIDWLGKQYGV